MRVRGQITEATKSCVAWGLLHCVSVLPSDWSAHLGVHWRCYKTHQETGGRDCDCQRVTAPYGSGWCWGRHRAAGLKGTWVSLCSRNRERPFCKVCMGLLHHQWTSAYLQLRLEVTQSYCFIGHGKLLGDFNAHVHIIISYIYLKSLLTWSQNG